MEDNLSETDIRDQEDDFRLMILFGGFFLIISSLILIICITTCLLCCEDDMDSNSRNLQYLIQLTKLNLNSLPGLSYEDRDKLWELRREIRRSEVIYKERHFNIYEVDHDSDEDIYDIHDSDEDDDDDDEFDDDEEDDEIEEYIFEDTINDCRCDRLVIDDMSEVADFPRVLPSQEIPPGAMGDNLSRQSEDSDLTRQPVTRETSNYAGSVVNQLLFGRLSHKMQSTPDGGMKVVLRQQCEARL